jgi:F0F1-type ATP synthase delta subunit
MAKSGKVVFAENLTEEQQGRLKKALKDAADSHLRSEAEAEYLREVIKKIADDLKIPKKLVNQLAKTYHKKNFDEVVAEHEQFEKFYKAVDK